MYAKNRPASLSRQCSKAEFCQAKTQSVKTFCHDSSRSRLLNLESLCIQERCWIEKLSYDDPFFYPKDITAEGSRFSQTYELQGGAFLANVRHNWHSNLFDRGLFLTRMNWDTLGLVGWWARARAAGSGNLHHPERHLTFVPASKTPTTRYACCSLSKCISKDIFVALVRIWELVVKYFTNPSFSLSSKALTCRVICHQIIGRKIVAKFFFIKYDTAITVVWKRQNVYVPHFQVSFRVSNPFVHLSFRE